jgi:uncharacterized protein YqgV (UPF0045/DUF77 family)
MKSMSNVINAAIQVLPQVANEDRYGIVDQAIDEIKNSGLTYLVCPFETVVEGEYNQVISLLGKIKDRCFHAGAEELLINIKIQVRKDKKVTMEEKIGKYIKK